MNTNEQEWPVFGCRRFDEAQKNEIVLDTVNEIVNAVKGTLGPRGLDTLVVREQESEEIRGFVSNDGGAIINEFESISSDPVVEHFISTLRAQEDEYGDGTTTTTILSGELIETGFELIEEGITAPTIIDGFSIAAQRTLEIWDEISIPLTSDGEIDRDRMEMIATAAMTGGDVVSWPLDGLSEHIVDAAIRVADWEAGTVDLSLVDTQAIPGGDVTDSTVLEGKYIPKEPMVPYPAPPLEGKALFVSGKFESPSPNQQMRFTGDDVANVHADTATRKTKWFRNLVTELADAGVVAVFSGQAVSVSDASTLADAGIITVQDVPDHHLQFLANASGGTVQGAIVPTEPIKHNWLGKTSITVPYQDIGESDEWLRVEGIAPEKPDAMTITVRGGSKRMAEEAQRRIKHGLNGVRAAIKRPQALPGGGAPEVAAAASVRELAPRIGDRRQLVVEAFANVLETIPATIARNAGTDPTDQILAIRSAHANNNDRAGIGVDGTVDDDVVTENNALDPMLVRTNALVRAVELANSYIRIDDIVYNRKPFEPERKSDQMDQEEFDNAMTVRND